jgi:DNA repair protein RadC
MSFAPLSGCSNVFSAYPRSLNTNFSVFQFPFVSRKRLISGGGYNLKPIIMQNEKLNQLAEIKVSYSVKTKPSERIKITNSKDAYNLFREIWSDQIELREEFLALFLNRANHVIGWHLVSVGGTSGTVVDPKIIFSVALKCMAHGIILCHNHPSGNLNPSEADKQLTTKLKKGCAILDITLLDHLIITNDGYFSFADQETI